MLSLFLIILDSSSAVLREPLVCWDRLFHVQDSLWSSLGKAKKLLQKVPNKLFRDLFQTLEGAGGHAARETPANGGQGLNLHAKSPLLRNAETINSDGVLEDGRAVILSGTKEHLEIEDI